MANNQNFDLKVSFSADLGNTGVVFRQVHQNIATSFGNLGSTITGTGAVVKKGLDDVGSSASNNAEKHKEANKQIVDSSATMADQLKNGFNIYDFIELLSDKCAAFFIESNSQTDYKVIFNTYNFMAIYDNMSLNDKFKFKL